ncbi:Solute carrier 49 member 4 [Mactra antiquata]
MGKTCNLSNQSLSPTSSGVNKSGDFAACKTVLNTDNEREAINPVANDTSYGSVQATNLPVQTAVYRVRWYILLVLCGGIITQSVIWGTWGPITDSAKLSMSSGFYLFYISHSTPGNMTNSSTTSFMTDLNSDVFGMSAVLFISTLIYYPSKPKYPPSVSAAEVRLNFKQGLFQLIKIVNSFQQRMKQFLLSLFVASVLMLVWIVCMISEFIPPSAVMIGIAITFLGIFDFSIYALSYEVACETGYPIHEAVIGTLLTLALNVASVLFLLVQLIPNIGTAWMTWTLLGSFVFGLILFATLKEKFKRYEIDISHDRLTEMEQ